MDEYRAEVGAGFLALAGGAWIAALTVIGTTSTSEWTDGIPISLFVGGGICAFAGAAVLGWIRRPRSQPVSARFTSTEEWLGIHVTPKRTLPDTTLQLLIPKALRHVSRVEHGKDVKPAVLTDSDEELIPGVPYILWGERQMHFPGRVERRLEFRIGNEPGVYPVKLRLVADELRNPADFFHDLEIPISERHVELDERRRAELLAHLRRLRRDLMWNKEALRRACLPGEYWSTLEEGPIGTDWSRTKAVIERSGRYLQLLEAVTDANEAIDRIAGRVMISQLKEERPPPPEGVEDAIVLHLHALLLIDRAEKRELARPPLTVGAIPNPVWT